MPSKKTAKINQKKEEVAIAPKETKNWTWCFLGVHDWTVWEVHTYELQQRTCKQCNRMQRGYVGFKL